VSVGVYVLGSDEGRANGNIVGVCYWSGDRAMWGLPPEMGQILSRWDPKWWHLVMPYFHHC